MKRLFYLVYFLSYVSLKQGGKKYSWLVQQIDPYTNSQHKNVVELSNNMKGNTGLKVLDIGSGTQWPRDFFERKSIQYIGCDVENSESANKQNFYVKDELLPIRDDEFDLVLSLSVLEHLKKPELSISEMFRVLKPGGKIFLQTNFLYQEHGAPHDFFRFSIFAITELLESTGFINLTPKKIGYRFSLMQHNILNAYLRILNMPLDNLLQGKRGLNVPLLPLIWLINLLVGQLIMLGLVLMNYIGQYMSRNQNVFYLGVSVQAEKP